MRMRQVVGGVWGVLIQVVGVGKWAFLAISGLGELEKLKHCQIPPKPTHNPRHPRHSESHKALAFVAMRGGKW